MVSKIKRKGGNISCCNVFWKSFKKKMILSHAKKSYPILMLLSRIWYDYMIISGYIWLFMKCDFYDEH